MAPPRALERLRTIGPVFRSREAVAAGVSWRDLYRLRDEGELLELSRGLFQLAEAAGVGNIDFVAVCARAPHGMVALESALAYWDLTDQIPSEVHLAVPEGTHRPVIDYPPTRVHVFRAATFDMGRLEVREAGGERFWITDRERSVVDAFRLRHLVGETEAHGALRRYLRQPRPRLAKLADVGRTLRATGPLSAALRVLQE
ncbi:MAG TPA: type IV toxin-antitoxin system AbiEi family antitoxin domain-containing protein [Jiangellales bacterium]|nr:type IV toxin-antitoxin system AbiEi family antitoxin domain-containing protein [Jiangellales bacterium]